MQGLLLRERCCCELSYKLLSSRLWFRGAGTVCGFSYHKLITQTLRIYVFLIRKWVLRVNVYYFLPLSQINHCMIYFRLLNTFVFFLFPCFLSVNRYFPSHVVVAAPRCYFDIIFMTTWFVTQSSKYVDTSAHSVKPFAFQFSDNVSVNESADFDKAVSTAGKISYGNDNFYRFTLLVSVFLRIWII